MKRIASLLLMLSLLLAGCPNPTPTTPTPVSATPVATLKAPTPTPKPTDLMSTMAAAGNLTTFVAGLQTVDLTEKLKSPGPFTIFAPTDQAFAALNQSTLDDPAHFFDVMLYHIAATRLLTTSLNTTVTVTTLLGEDVQIGKTGRVYQINDAELAMPPIQATNGLIYVINKVLLPTTQSSADVANASQLGTINQVLAADPRFGTLVDALKATGVYTDLQGAGPFTLFAPVNQAFSTLPTPLVDNLFKGTSVWTRVLHYHLVPGKKLLAAGFMSKQVEQTQEGSPVVITTKDKTIFVEAAKVIQTDIIASNGVIHVIDQVLVPPLD